MAEKKTSRKFKIGTDGVITDNVGRKYSAEGALLHTPKGKKPLPIPASHPVTVTAVLIRSSANYSRVQRAVAKNPAIAVARTAKPAVTAEAIQKAADGGDRYAKAWATRLAKYGIAGKKK